MALIEFLPAASPDRSRDTDSLRAASLGPLFRLLLGGALVLSAFGLWLVPGAGGAPSLMLIRLGLSVALLTGGLGLFSGALHRRG